MKSNLPSLEPSVARLTSFVYFVQGAIGIAGIALPLFLRQKGWSIPQIATFSSLSAIPWALKIVYGATSDVIPIGGLRRKPYVILASLLCLGAWVGFSFLPEHPSLIYLFALAANTGFAITDVVTDALIVENSTESNTRAYQSLAWGFRSFGAVLGGVTGGWLAQYVPYQWVFGLTALLPLATLFAVVSIREAPHHPKREETAFLWTPIFEGLRALFRGDLKWFSGYILVGSFSASFSTPFFFFLKEKLTFSESFLGTLSSLTWLGAIAGCFLHGKLFGKLSLKTGLRIAVWLNTLNILSTYLVINRSSATALSLLGGVLAYLSLLPLMGAAALLSRQKGMEGSLFALLMSVNNLGQIVSAFMGAKLFAIIGLKFLIFFSALIGLCGLFFVGRLKKLG